VLPSRQFFRSNLPPATAREYSRLSTQLTTPRSMAEFDASDLHENVRSDNGVDHFQGYPPHVRQITTYNVQPRATYSEVPPSYGPNHQTQTLSPLWPPNSSNDFVNIRIETPEDQTYTLPNVSTSYDVSPWTDSSTSGGSTEPSNYYSLPSYPAPPSQLFHPYPTIEPSGSPTSMLSSPGIPSTTPTSICSASLSPSLLSCSAQVFAYLLSLIVVLICLKLLQNQDIHRYSYRDQAQFFRDALNLPMSSGAGEFVPQQMYRPHTNSDRRRYVEEVQLEQPIYFWTENPAECGIPLVDALHSRVRRLQNRDEAVFAGRGPSISVRIQASDDPAFVPHIVGS
jgi:hypothetical protein